jgi:DNA helicase-2/ATP-dependent DNA helicase PcrA
VFDADHRLVEAFQRAAPASSGTGGKRGEDRDDRRARGWPTLFHAPWSQVLRYRACLDGDAELATPHVVKGFESKRVMVVMDDEEAGGTMFSYDKLFGAEALSGKDP